MAEQRPEFDTTNTEDAVNSAAPILDGTGSGRMADVVDDLGVKRVAVAPGNITINPIPFTGAVHRSDTLSNGGSTDMTVNGTPGTPIVFSAGPTAGEVWHMTGIGLFILDAGTLDANNFGALSELTNGLLVEQTINSVDIEIGNFKNNTGLSFYFSSGQTLGQSSGWLNTNKVFIGLRDLRPNVSLTGDDGDVIKATVRDSLSGLGGLEISFLYWEQP